jgi:hypothetical protein
VHYFLNQNDRRGSGTPTGDKSSFHPALKYFDNAPHVNLLK